MTINIQLNQYDDEFSKAMIQTELSAKVVYQFSKIGIQSWNNLNPVQKSKVLKMIGLAMSQNINRARELKTILYDSELLPMFCVYYRVMEVEIEGVCSME